MSMKERVSIITVTYNVADTIEQTINSVINQSYDDIEYIVVDGMSTDGTWEKICKYKEKINILLHEKDKGLYDAMNKGIARATGDIIGIVNGDDWYERDAIENVVKNMQDNGDILYARMNIIDSDGNIQMISKPDKIENIWYRMIPHPTVFVRKKVYDTYGAFKLDYPIVADYEMIFRFYLAGVKFKYIDQVITNFRRGGLTTKKSIACAREVREISMMYLEKCPEKERCLQNINNNYNRAMISAACEQNNEYFKGMLDLLFHGKTDNILIFGAGVWGRKCAEKLRQCNIVCQYFIDNSPKKQAAEIDGIKVIAPERLGDMECNIIIALADGYDEISEQLNNIHNPRLQWIRLFDLYDENQGDKDS